MGESYSLTIHCLGGSIQRSSFHQEKLVLSPWKSLCGSCLAGHLGEPPLTCDTVFGEGGEVKFADCCFLLSFLEAKPSLSGPQAPFPCSGR